MTVSWESKQFCWSVSGFGTFWMVGFRSGITIAVLDPAFLHKKCPVQEILQSNYRHKPWKILIYRSFAWVPEDFLAEGKKTLPKLMIKTSHALCRGKRPRWSQSINHVVPVLNQITWREEQVGVGTVYGGMLVRKKYSPVETSVLLPGNGWAHEIQDGTIYFEMCAVVFDRLFFKYSRYARMCVMEQIFSQNFQWGKITWFLLMRFFTCSVNKWNVFCGHADPRWFLCYLQKKYTDISIPVPVRRTFRTSTGTSVYWRS